MTQPRVDLVFESLRLKEALTHIYVQTVTEWSVIVEDEDNDTSEEAIELEVKRLQIQTLLWKCDKRFERRLERI
jgi:hypothetical protein